MATDILAKQKVFFANLLAAWYRERNECSDADMCRIEAKHARSLGLPTLAALFEALDRVQHAQGLISPAEVEDLLRKVLQAAKGEATERIRLILGDPAADGVPGLGIIPYRLLERLEGDHD